MPPIDPQQLLKALGPLLTPTGGVRGAQEASRIASLMKDASKLVTRCIYLNILRVTDSKEALEKFMEVGGWDTLNTWLEIARDDNNDPLLGELLEVYQVMPVTVGLLKQNSAAKTIKQLSKAEKEKIKSLSSTLVDRWTKIIRGQNNGTDNDADDKKKKKKHKDKDRDKEKDKERNEKDKENDKKERDEKDSEKHKNRDKDSKEHHHHHRDKEKDREKEKDRKDKDRHKDKDRERDKDKSRREKSRSSSDSKESSKNQTSSSGSSESSSNKSKDSSSASKRSSIDELKTTTSSSSTTNSSTTSTKTQEQDSSSKDDESRRRPKTVKQLVTKFRSTGLFDDEEEEEVGPVKKKPEKPLPVKRTGIDIKPEESSEKKPRLHLTMPTLTPANVDSASTTPPEVTHGRIKLIAPKRPPAHEIQESNVFMDALQQSTYSTGIKKKKKLVSPSTTAAPVLLRSGSATSPPPASSPPSATSPPPGPPGSESGPTSPPLLSPTSAMAQKLPSVPSFYRDTLEDVPESTVDNKKEEENEDDSPPSLVNMEVDEAGKEEEGKVGDQSMETVDDKSGIPSLEDGDNANEAGGDMDQKRVGRKPKKSVTWAKETHLEEIFYFEMDETERENVNRPKTFNEMKKEEMIMDRRAMETVKRFNNDTMVEVLQWKRPKPVDNVIALVEPGCNSVERSVQMERERVVLCAIFFNKVPDTPAEPDPDISTDKADTKIIPLEDENGSCTEYEHTYNFSDPSSLPYDPEFGGLPLQNQGPPVNQGGNAMGGGNMNNMGNNNPMGNMNNNMVNNRGHMNIPPPINHILNTLQQQAQETRDPIMQNLQGMLTSVLQNTNPQDSGMLMERILSALEPFKNQIPGLGNLINSVTGGNGMDGNMGGPGGPRFMGPGQMGNPRHGLLGSAPPGFNMMGGGGGNMRPGMQGPSPHMGNSGGGMGGNPNYYMGGGGGGGGNMRMGGPWRGRSRPYGKRGGPRNVVCQYYVKKGNCKYGDGCQFIHPGPNS